MTTTESPADEPKANAQAARPLFTNLKLLAKAAARATMMFAVYTVVGMLFHWGAFLFAARDIWHDTHWGRIGVTHGGGAAFLYLVVFVLTPQGFATTLYLLGLPALCFLLGKQMAMRAAIHRILQDKASGLAEPIADFATHATAPLTQTPGLNTARALGQSLHQAVEAYEGSRATRFVLRALLRAVALPELLFGMDFLARRKADPEGARAELRAALEPRIAGLGEPASFVPLAAILALTTVLTLTSSWWTTWYHH